jgi:hypothetical protein
VSCITSVLQCLNVELTSFDEFCNINTFLKENQSRILKIGENLQYHAKKLSYTGPPSFSNLDTFFPMWILATSKTAQKTGSLILSTPLTCTVKFCSFMC